MGIEIRQLIDDCKFWLTNNTCSDEEIAIRFKHRIVKIHCFPNGNGRHSRLIGDIIINQIFNKPVFTWNNSNLNKNGEARSKYLAAIRAADKGNINPLIDFART